LQLIYSCGIINIENKKGEKNMYQAISKQQAKELYNRGEKVLLVPSSHDVKADWSIKVRVSKEKHGLPFNRVDKLITEYQTSARDNNKLAYYIEK